MLYLTSLHSNGYALMAALIVAIGFVIISIVKEKSDERKRA